MVFKVFIFSLLIGLACAQEGVKNPVVIRAGDFKEGITMNLVLDQIHKKIIPKKSTKEPLKCFWMLGDKKYLIVHVLGRGEGMEIEPMMVKKLDKPDKDGGDYLINTHERVSFEMLKEALENYNELARANNTEPLVMIRSGKSKLKENLAMLNLLSESGIKYVCIPDKKAEPAKTELRLPVPKPLPASPHKR